MKKTTFVSFVLFCTVTFPLPLYAQVPFGGLDSGTFSATCSMPPLSLYLALSNKPCMNYPIPSPNLPVAAFFDLFTMMKGPAVPPWGFMAVPLSRKVLYGVVAPGAWALGLETPGGPVGGFFIPGFTIYMPSGPPICIESTCMPFAYPVGTINPIAGTSISI